MLAEKWTAFGWIKNKYYILKATEANVIVIRIR